MDYNVQAVASAHPIPNLGPLQSPQMPARLIINADDFGLTPGINRAIIELHQAGVVSSATLMATGPAFQDAVTVALANPTLGVGCHIVLVDGTPISPPESIPTLLASDRKNFRPSLTTFARDLFLGRIDESEIEREALAQIQKLQRAGIDVTHLDTHKHTHTFPRVARPLTRIVNRTSIACMRNPFEPAFSFSASRQPLLRQAQLAVLNRFQPTFDKVAAEALTLDGTLGIAATGTLNAPTLQRLLNSLPQDGTYELCCHPGYNDADLNYIHTRLRETREIERQALRQVIPEILSHPSAPQLIHYGNLGGFGAMREIGLFYPNTGYEQY